MLILCENVQKKKKDSSVKMDILSSFLTYAQSVGKQLAM